MVLSKKAEKGFFDLAPYTKIASWGRQFQNLNNYVYKNEVQANQNIKKQKFYPEGLGIPSRKYPDKHLQQFLLIPVS